MVHTRETRASASEVKFLVQPSLVPQILEWARTHLEADPHGSGPFGDEYETSSLYFDTVDFDVFHRRGSFGRAKYRVRRYGHGDVVFLERKLRKPRLLIKRRTLAQLSSLNHLNGTPRPDWGGAWFQRRLLVRKLQPVCQVSYRRTARTVETLDGRARLTLDCDLCAAAIDEPFFAAPPAVPFLQDSVILELKYRLQPPGIFKQLIEEFALHPASASKYRFGMIAAGHVPNRTAAPILAGTDPSYA